MLGLIGSIIGMVFGFLSRVLIIRYITQEEYGIYSLALVLFSIFIVISNSISSFIIMVLFWVWVPDTQCGYRAYSKKALKIIMSSLKSEGYEGETEMIILARINRFKIKKIGIQTVYNEEESKVSPVRDIRRFTFTAAKMRISYIRRQMTGKYLRYKFNTLKKHFLNGR